MTKLILQIGLLWCVITAHCAAEPIRVTSLSSILTEIVQQVGGDQVKLTALVKPGTDPHEYEPKPADLKVIASSQLVVACGRNMEGYLPKLREGAGAKAALLEVGNHITALKVAAHSEAHHDHDHDHHHHSESGEDPHWWHSIEAMQTAVRVVRNELTRIAPQSKATFDGNAKNYVKRLEDLRKWAKRKVAELPRDRRKLITSHDAFQYFARENGFTIYAVEGLSTEAELSSRAVARVIDTIKKEKVKAVFLESNQNPKVIQEITRETGAVVGGTLHADGLGENDAATYEGMIRHNITTIVDALK